MAKKARKSKPLHPTDFSRRPHPKGAWFDEAAAQKVEQFFSRYLKHSKGSFAGRPFVLEPWQLAIIREAFGWKLASGWRQYRTLYIEIPKKNGKSTFAAGLGLYFTCADGEPGAEVYASACDKLQAQIVFDEARAMRDVDPVLSAILVENKLPAIYHQASRSRFQPLTSKPGGKHGFNPHAIIIDELHAWPDRELYDNLVLGVAARDQPMVVVITTAGFDRNSICWEQHEYAQKVRDGLVHDESFLPVIFGADEKDDWKSPATWAKANPSFGVTVKASYFESAVRKAAETPAGVAVFRRLHLNVWTQNVTAWLSDEFDACNGAIDEATLEGRECFVGLDLSSTTDITAAVAVFPTISTIKVEGPDGEEIEVVVRHYDVLCRFWMPKEHVERRAKKDRAPYGLWIEQGLIEATDGNVIDYEYIRRQLLDWDRRFRIREVAYDEWNASQMIIKLSNDDGVKCVPFRQGYKSLSPATKATEAIVIGRRLVFNNNPVLRWMVSNVQMQQDAAGNIKPAKDRSTGRIDGVVALIMAIGRCELQEEAGESSYASIVQV